MNRAGVQLSPIKHVSRVIAAGRTSMERRADSKDIHTQLE